MSSALLIAAPSTPPCPVAVRSTLPPVSQSCLRLAALRAEETERATSADPHITALVVDPFAAALAGFRKPADAHFVFRQANQKRVRQEAEDSAAQDASAAAVASAEAAAAATSSSSSTSSCSAAALRSTLLSRASALNQDRSLAPDTMIRTRFMDDFIKDACASDASPLPQLVLLGAGLDSRAYRLDCLKNTAVFELDVEGVLQYKAAVFTSLAVQPVARSLKRVPADFSVQGDVVRVSKTSMKQHKKQRRAATDDQSSSDSAAPTTEVGPQHPPWLAALLEAGFDPRQRTVWVAEGLLMYLDANQVANMLTWIAHLVNKSSAAVPAAPASASPSSSVAQVTPALPLHTLVADIMNENMVRSKLKWFRFFRWGLARHVEPTLKGQPPLLSPIEAFMRTNGFEIATRSLGYADEGYAKSPAAGSASSSSSSDPTPPPAPAHLHIHPIGRAHLSYGRYLAPPLLDAESDSSKPPRLLETYLIVAQIAFAAPAMSSASAPCYLDRQPAVVIQLFFQSLDCPTKLLMARCSRYLRSQADQPASWKHTPCIVRSSEVRFYNRKAPQSLVRHAPCRWLIEESIDAEADEADLSARMPPRLHTVFIGAYVRLNSAAFIRVFSDPLLAQLQELVMFDNLDAAEMTLLASLPKLARLSFSPSDVHVAIAGLAASSSITRLSISVFGPVAASDALTPMPTLRHLTIVSGVDEWPQFAALCRQLPQLTSLSMRWIFREQPEDKPAVEAALRSISALHTIELHSVRDVSLALDLLAACGFLRTLILPVSVEDFRFDVLRSLEALLATLPLLRVELIVEPKPATMPVLGLDRVHLRGRYC